MPDTAEARRYLAEVVALVEAGRARELCALGSAVCPRFMTELDPAAVPLEAPIVLGTRTIAPERLGPDVWSMGGLVLELCGLDGTGRAYRSEMLVFREEGRLLSTVPMYWLGLRVEEDGVVRSDDLPPEGCPPAMDTPTGYRAGG